MRWQRDKGKNISIFWISLCFAFGIFLMRLGGVFYKTQDLDWFDVFSPLIYFGGVALVVVVLLFILSKFKR